MQGKNLQTAQIFKHLSITNEQQLILWLCSHHSKAVDESIRRYEVVKLSTSAGT